MHWNPANKRDVPRKVRFTNALDRKLQKDAAKAGMEYATFLYTIIEEAARSGAIEDLIEARTEQDRTALRG